MKKILSLLMILVLAGCGYIDNPNHVEDTNGDDTSIITFTEEEKVYNNYDRGVGEYKSKTTNNSIEGQMCFEKFTGVLELHIIREFDVNYSFDILLESGNFEIIIVSNEMIVKSFSYELSKFIVSDSYNCETDEVQILKIIGESTKFRLSYIIEY